MNGSILEFVLHNLERSRGSWPEIARVTGVSYSALSKLAQRQHANPRLDKIEKLARYFKRAS